MKPVNENAMVIWDIWGRIKKFEPRLKFQPRLKYGHRLIIVLFFKYTAF